MKKILFVCTGNICRSPTAHAIARHKIKLAGLEKELLADGAGTTSFHAGEEPDHRAIAVGKDRGIDFSQIKSRPVTEKDFAKFDFIFAMDRSHFGFLKSNAPSKHQNKVHLFLEYAEIRNASNYEVKDPYYGGVTGFEKVFDLIEDGVEKIINKIKIL